MKPSKFNIVQPYGDNVLIYNTFSTSMVEIEPQLYTNIFENGEIRYKKPARRTLFDAVKNSLIRIFNSTFVISIL